MTNIFSAAVFCLSANTNFQYSNLVTYNDTNQDFGIHFKESRNLPIKILDNVITNIILPTNYSGTFQVGTNFYRIEPVVTTNGWTLESQKGLSK